MYHRLVDSVVDYAIFALDREGHVLSWNLGAQRIKGWTASEIVGHHFSTFYTPEDVEAGLPDHELEEAARVGRFEDEGWRARKDGSRFWANVVISAVKDGRGRVTGFAKVTRDLTERRQAEEALRAGEAQFRLLVQGVKDYAILLLDPDGIVSSWNDGAERIKGFRAEDILGRSFETFYPEEAVADGFPRYELEVAAREGSFEDENWRVRKDGSRFWANVVITALRDETGELVGYAKVTRDLTARREAEEQARRLAAEQAAHAEAARRSAELERLNGQLREQTAALELQTEEARVLAEHVQEANQELDQFAYVASHDLKAPLRGIANLAQWIQDDSGARLTGDSAEHMRLLHGRVRRMEALIDGILAYSRAGRSATRPEPVETGDLLREVVELQAPPEGVAIDIAPDMPLLETERVPLQQVFMNLLGNAIKYSTATRDDVRIEVGWRDLGDSFEFVVTDNGPGIAPEFHERIWGIFQTLAARDEIEGTGIGLSVVKKIVETRGGAVSLESSPGQGATFRFTWPKGHPGARS